MFFIISVYLLFPNHDKIAPHHTNTNTNKVTIQIHITYSSHIFNSTGAANDVDTGAVHGGAEHSDHVCYAAELHGAR